MKTNLTPQPANNYDPSADENRIRQQCVALVDDVYDAFRAAGHPVGDYTRIQFFETLLISAINELPLTHHQRLGALLVFRLFLRKEVAYFKDEATKKGGKSAGRIRET